MTDSGERDINIKELRRRMKAVRAEIDPADKKERDSRIGEFITDMLLDLSLGNVLCFYPLPGEPDLLPFAQDWIDRGISVYFPVTEDLELSFYRPKDLNDFSEGAFHVMEPISRDALFGSGPKTLNLVPGLAFTKDCDRIGYGKGCYDRFIAKNYNLENIGVCYREQVVPSLPVFPWDQKLNLLVSV